LKYPPHNLVGDGKILVLGKLNNLLQNVKAKQGYQGPHPLGTDRADLEMGP
jgi:hypothetical protein